MPADTVNFNATSALPDPGWTLLTPDGRDPTNGSRQVASLVIPQLLAWIRMGRADRALDALRAGSCGNLRMVDRGAWLALTPNQKLDLLATTVANYTCQANTLGSYRVDPNAIAVMLRSAELEAVIRGLDQAAVASPSQAPQASPVGVPNARLGMAATHKVAPAGSAYTEARSYANGPTLLFAAAALGAGYLTSRWLAR